MFRAASAAIARRPFVAAVLIGGAKNGICDLSVQLAFEDRVDWRRNGIFVGFGFLWVGGGQWVLFNKLFPRLFPGLTPGASGRSTRSALGAALFDNFVHIPLGYLPTFYMLQASATNPHLGPGEAARVGLNNYWSNMREDVAAQAGIFLPVQCFNFTLNPAHLRVPTTIAAGAVWISILSFRRGATSSGDQATEP